MRFVLILLFTLAIDFNFPGIVAASDSISLNSKIDGKLGEGYSRFNQRDGCFFNEYVVWANEPGTLVQIFLHSKEFDSFLKVTAPDGSDYLFDDYEETLDSVVAFNVYQPGEIRIIVTTYEKRKSGNYSLEVKTLKKPQFFGIFTGIENYGRDWKPAPLCDRDAEKMFDSFIETGLMKFENGICLTNRDVRTDFLKSSFELMSSMVGPDDVFIFFFSGYGDQLDCKTPDPADIHDGKDEFICLKDKSMSDNELAELLDTINAGLIVIVIDACKSGGFARDLITKPGRVLYASCEEDALSAYATDVESGGYLSLFFRDAIYGDADLDGNGIIFFGELTRYIQSRYNNEISFPESSFGGYMNLVVERGSISQHSMFSWIK